MSHKLLVVKNLRKWFKIRRGLFKTSLYVKAVDNVSFTLDSKEAIAIVGESGSGKTTLGKTILRLYEPTDGKIMYNGKNVAHISEKNLFWYKREAQLIQQDPFGSLPPFFTVYKILEEPLLIHKVGNKNERREMIYRALEDVKLRPVEEFAAKYPHMMSGGQRQRVAIARALILRPKLIVADEPVSMLDASVRVEVLKLLKDIQMKRGIAFMYITHDLSTTRYFSDRLMIMYAGKVMEIGNIEDIIKEPLHPYTKALLEAIPDPDPENRKIIRNVPPGEPPNLVNPPPGCRFHPRCPYAMEICRKKEPPLIEVEPGRFVKCWLFAETKKD